MADVPISGLPHGGPIDGTEAIPVVQGGVTVQVPSAALVGAPGIGIVPGVVLPFAGGAAPAGFLPCDGSTVSQTTYPALYAVLGTLWGPDAGGNFTLPDLRDRCLIGTSPGGLGADRPTARSAGQVGGEESHVLTIAQLAAHGHSVTDPTHQHSADAFGGSYLAGSAVARATTNGAGGTFGHGATGLGSHIATELAATGVSVDSTGSGDPHNTMPPFAVIQWIIKT
jgi:microcystin-dependent protein